MNFQKLINELNAKDPVSGRKIMTQAQIAARTGLSISAIVRLQQGKGVEPRFTPGYKLVTLHDEVVQRGQR